MISNDTILIVLAAVVACVLAFYFIVARENKDHSEPTDPSKFQERVLREKIAWLVKHVDRLNEEKMMLNDKIKAIHFSQGIEREQTRYLTSNLNAHTGLQKPTHGGAE